MRALMTIGILATAGAAVAMDELGRHQEGGDHSSCCAPAAKALRSSYLEPANPPGPGEVTGKITGKIVFEGEKRPEVQPNTITDKQAEGCRDDGKPVDPTNLSVVIDKDGGIKNCVIEVAVKGAELKLPEAPIEVDQVQCLFDPHVVLLPAGATVAFLNSDKVSHNVNIQATRNTAFNKIIAAGSKETHKFEKAEAVEVKCDVHPWMSAYLYVTDTPYATISAADGTFTVEGLKPGEYKLDIWHEKLGKVKAEAVVKEDGSSEAIEIKLGEKKGGGRGRR